MYSPYLFARAAELLSLREIADNNLNTNGLLPILEPVNANTNSLIKCLNAWSEDVVVIINPYQNDYSKPNNVTKFNQDLHPIISSKNNIIIGLLVRSGITVSYLTQKINSFTGSRIALLYDNASLNDSDMNILASNTAVNYHIIINNSVPIQQHQSLPTNKLIMVNNSFRKLTKNADYSGSEFFTNAHKYINQSYVGFGDFTITGEAFETGGGPASAVASHLIYKNLVDDSIWIQHFISSNTTRGGAPVATMFLDVSDQITNTVPQRIREFGTNIGLDHYIDCSHTRHFPGLAKNKQYQITHHICLMLDVLNNRI
ncbi:sce7725 family protein [Proteus terrae]|uniref:sce7725 family protein n=1 Tax=Proteus terrae TaxID=1574161 RepID=UPI0032DB51F4